MLIKLNEKSWLQNNTTNKSDNSNQKKGNFLALFFEDRIFLVIVIAGHVPLPMKKICSLLSPF